MRIRKASRWIVVGCALLVASQAGLVLHQRTEIGLLSVLLMVCLVVVVAFQAPRLFARQFLPASAAQAEDRLAFAGAACLIAASAAVILWVG